MARTLAWVGAGLTVATVATFLLLRVLAILHTNGWGS